MVIYRAVDNPEDTSECLLALCRCPRAGKRRHILDFVRDFSALIIQKKPYSRVGPGRGYVEIRDEVVQRT